MFKTTKTKVHVNGGGSKLPKAELVEKKNKYRHEFNNRYWSTWLTA